jgi:hypothetical protein
MGSDRADRAEVSQDSKEQEMQESRLKPSCAGKWGAKEAARAVVPEGRWVERGAVKEHVDSFP